MVRYLTNTRAWHHVSEPINFQFNFFFVDFLFAALSLYLYLNLFHSRCISLKNLFFAMIPSQLWFTYTTTSDMRMYVNAPSHVFVYASHQSTVHIGCTFFFCFLSNCRSWSRYTIALKSNCGTLWGCKHIFLLYNFCFRCTRLYLSLALKLCLNSFVCKAFVFCFSSFFCGCRCSCCWCKVVVGLRTSASISLGRSVEPTV